jgi:hypothetical protein
MAWPFTTDVTRTLVALGNWTLKTESLCENMRLQIRCFRIIEATLKRAIDPSTPGQIKNLKKEKCTIMNFGHYLCHAARVVEAVRTCFAAAVSNCYRSLHGALVVFTCWWERIKVQHAIQKFPVFARLFDLLAFS